MTENNQEAVPVVESTQEEKDQKAIDAMPTIGIMGIEIKMFRIGNMFYFRYPDNGRRKATMTEVLQFIQIQQNDFMIQVNMAPPEVVTQNIDIDKVPELDDEAAGD